MQRVQAGSEHERRLFSCGVPMTGVDLRIVDADSAQPCKEGHVGEIWLSSPCVTAGYYNRPAVNQKAFQVCNHLYMFTRHVHIRDCCKYEHFWAAHLYCPRHPDGKAFSSKSGECG